MADRASCLGDAFRPSRGNVTFRKMEKLWDESLHRSLKEVEARINASRPLHPSSLAAEANRYGEGCSADVQCQMARKLIGFDPERLRGSNQHRGTTHGEPQ